jgi:hypothetical protein
MFKIFVFLVSIGLNRIWIELFHFFFKENGETTNEDTIVISRDALSALMINNDSYTPRTVVLQRGKKGFGFVLRGSRGNYSFQRNIFLLKILIK